MNIEAFISKYKNHPVLFVGAGMSLRYLENSYSWDALLSKIALEIFDSEEVYLNLKSYCINNDDICDYEKLGSKLEAEFNALSSQEPLRSGKFKEINDHFFEEMKLGNKLSRFKLYIAELLGSLTYKSEMLDEIR